jgi:hypothetical protein
MFRAESPALPGWACSRASGRGSSKGGGAPAPRHRETTSAFEAEAGKTTGPTPFGIPEGEGGLCPACLEGKGGGEQWQHTC